MNDPRSDAAISRDVAQDAGQLLLRIRQDFIAEHGPIGDKETANKLRDRADAASNDLILDFLSSARPQDAVLSEEAKDDPSRLDSERVWIVDPLDGTWEYGQNRADFAVHVALWAAGELHACTVDLPAQGITRSVLDDTVETAVDPTRPIRIVASRSRPPATLQATCNALGRLLSDAGITDRGVEVVDVGKLPDHHPVPQDEINRILVDRALAGKLVVRLKGGDPFVFGRGGEEALACAAAGVPVRVLPGVTSSVSAPALAGIPVTHRGTTQGFTVVSGHVPPGHPDCTVDWKALASTGTTLVVLMGVRTLPAIAEALVQGGLDPRTPAAVVADAGLPSQRRVDGTVATIADVVAESGIGAPAVTVVGHVVDVLS